MENRIRFIVDINASHLEAPIGHLRALSEYTTKLFVIAPFEANISVQASFTIHENRNILLSQYLTPVLNMKGKDLVNEAESIYQTVADWNVFGVTINPKVLAYISKYRAGRIGVSFNFKEALQNINSDLLTNYKGTIGSKGDIPNSTFNNGDYYVNDIYNYFSAKLNKRLTKGSIAYYQNNNWLEFDRYINVKNTSLEYLAVDPAVLAESPEISEETVDDILSSFIGTVSNLDSQYIVINNKLIELDNTKLNITDFNAEKNIINTEIARLENDKVDKSVYDTKMTEIDTTLDEKVNKNETYTKTETDSKIQALDNKKLDKTDFDADKTIINNELIRLDNDKADKSELFSGDYDDLTNKPTIPTQPTKVSELINDKNYVNENYVNSKLTAVYKFKGSVANYAALPTTDLTIGDVYDVLDTGDNYAWTGSDWDKLAGTIDLSNYYQKGETFSQEEINALLANYPTNAQLTQSFIGYMKKNKQNWANTRTYKEGEIVWFDGHYYHAKKDVPTGIALTNTSYWENLNQNAVNAEHVSNIVMEPQYDSFFISGAITNDGAYRKQTILPDVKVVRENGAGFLHDSRGRVATETHSHNEHLRLADIIDMARYKGTYEQNGDYQKGDIVKDGNNTFYMCVQNVLSGTPLPTEPSFYKLGGGGGGSATLNFRGVFEIGATYSAGDIVYSFGDDGGFLYLFTRDVANKQDLPELYDPYCIKIDQKAERLKVERISSFDNETTGTLLGVNSLFRNYANVLTEEFYPHTINDLKWVKENSKFVLYDSRGKLAALTDLFSKNYDDLINKPTLFSGSYNDLADKPNLDLKLDKNFSALPTQANPLLTDVLVSNRGTTVQKVTLGNLLAQVDNEIFEVVSVLPTTGVVNKIYLVPSSEPETQNTLDEFIWVDNAWEKIGAVSVDLSNYFNKTEINSMLDNKVDKNANITAGTHTKITYDAKGLVTGGSDLVETDIPNLAISKITSLQATLDTIETSKQDKLVAGDNITIDPTTNVISASGGSGGGEEVDLNEMAYFDYASRVYGDKYSLLANAWEHSLTVDPLEISVDSQITNPRGTLQYPNGEVNGVIIPNSVTSIGDHAFSSWSSNNQPLVIPNSVTSIGNSAFGFWSSNNQPLIIPNSVTSIGGSAFSNWSSNNHQLVIPNSVTSISNRAFDNWLSNNQPLVIPNSVTYIGDYAFRDWSSNNQPLIIPNSVTDIGTRAFYGWRSNKQPLVIPNSVTSIGLGAFNNWLLVPYVEIQAITPPTLASSDAFNNQNNAPIYVPDESVDAYKTATEWVDLADRIFPISDNSINLNDLDTRLDNVETSKQDKLIAGENITIDENTNVISASGGSLLQEAKDYTYSQAEIDNKDTTTLNNAKSYTDIKIGNLIGTAPETYDTLQEIAEYIAQDQTATTAILTEIATVKTDKVDKTVYNAKITEIETNKADKSTTYTKTEVDTALSGKANSTHSHSWSSITDKPSTFTPATHNHDTVYYKRTETYTKTEIDDLVANSSGGSSVDLSNYYNKTEIDAMIGDIESALDAILGV